MLVRRLLFFTFTGLALPCLVHAAAPLSPASVSPTPEQVINWINASAHDPVDLPHVDFELVNLDEDADLEIIPKQNASVHIGSFYVLDQKPDRTYSLIAEKRWNVPQLQPERWDYAQEVNHPGLDPYYLDSRIELTGTRLLETVDHTGGTGLSVYEAHLWYLEKGKLVEAWSGLLKQTSSVPGGQLFQTLGSYQIISGEIPQLYYWTTEQELDPDTGIPLPGKTATKLVVYQFDQGVFTPVP
ncbi:hypothetical protein [Brevibacillus agri]|uniref:hypothetical protein n=1 Tax=Brevibacillus agri TaxID=51101 RepID=UPI002E1D83EB|nr:hypothetical protein [Brevibacillus agri]